MTKTFSLYAFAVTIMSINIPAEASVLFSNFGFPPNFKYDSTNGYVVGAAGQNNEVIGVQFQPLSGGEHLFVVELPLSLISGTNEVSVYLYTDAGNQPGTIIGHDDVVGRLPLSAPIFPPTLPTFVSMATPVLAFGTPYWLVLSALNSDTAIEWYFNSVGDAPNATNYAFNGNGSLSGPWFHSPAGTARPTFQVEGTGAPEPGTLGLLGVGCATVFSMRLRRTPGAGIPRQG
jgi:hypothetical protein